MSTKGRDLSLLAELRRRNVIRVAVAYLAGAWLIVQIADTVFPAFGLPAGALAVLITILAIGLVPVLVVSWVFELTPEGFKRDEEVDPAASTARRTGRRIDRVILVVLALGIGYFAIDKFVVDPARDEAAIEQAAVQARSAALRESYDKSIAVLPFEDLSPSGDRQYFSDGVAEELLNLLARLPDLRVISRTSSFNYRGRELHVPTVAEKLGVSYVLEGSVRTDGDRVRVTAQLIEAPTDTHLWSQAYDEKIGDVFAIQDAIAGAIVDKLKIHLLQAQPRSRRTSPEAYELYMRANHLVREQMAGYEEALDLTERVLRIDPTYVPALTLQVLILHVAEAMDLARLKAYGVAGERPLDRALAIDPADGIANAYKGWREVAYHARVDAGVRHANKALAAEPQNAEVLRVTGAMAYMIGLFDEAIFLGERAIDRNPLCGWCDGTMFYTTYLAGDYERAGYYADRYSRQFGTDIAWLSYVNLLIVSGRGQEALDYMDRYDAERLEPAWNVKRAVARCRMGLEAPVDGRVEAAANALKSGELHRSASFPMHADLAAAYACKGDLDSAFAWLERALAAVPDAYHPPVRAMADVVWNPLLQPLHADPRWAAFRTSVGLGDEQLAGASLDLPPN